MVLGVRLLTPYNRELLSNSQKESFVVHAVLIAGTFGFCAGDN